MRVLLDECLPRKLKALLPGHDVNTVPEMGWAGTKDRQLLLLAVGGFDALVTVDQGLSTTARRAMGGLVVIILHAPSNRLADLEPLMSEVRETLPSSTPGAVIRVGI